MAKANSLSLHFLLMVLTISTLLRHISPSHSHPPPTTTPSPHSSPPSTTQSPQPPSSPPEDQLQLQILSNIVSALLNSGDFHRWATLLSAANNPIPSPFSTATFFVPSDQALSLFPTFFDPFLIPYHVIPQRLPFSDLTRFPNLTRLPTLLPSNSILLTTLNSGHSNLSVDGSSVTHPDLYVNSAVAVHGVNNLLDYSVYGTGTGSGDRTSLLPPPATTRGLENNKTVATPYSPCHERKSGGAGWGSGSGRFMLVFVVVCSTAFAFKI